jgi:hypothetical protein
MGNIVLTGDFYLIEKRGIISIRIRGYICDGFIIFYAL